MLSSFTSFLPSGLMGGKESGQRTPQPGAQGQLGHGPGSAAPSPTTEDDEDKGERKARRERSTTENFIVVRPPPSKSNHPLNLQLQLVPPSSKDKDRSSARRSVDLSEVADAAIAAAGASAPTTPTAAGEGASLSRSGSTRSTRSGRSEQSERSSSTNFGSSVSSFGSTASTSSGRRMIIPLYNLSAHNVMTNTVLDAGTDAKVAKYGKRGMEVVGLAVLEPTEVFGGMGYTLTTVDAAKHAVGAKNLPEGAEGDSPPGSNVSPISSAVSLSSASDTNPAAAVSTNTTGSTLQVPAQGGSRKLFGKMFKKREASHRNASSISSISEIVKPSVIAEPKPSQHRSSDLPPVLQPPVLGVQPTLSCTVYPPTGRPTRYVWTVKRWLKGSPEGLLGRLNVGGEHHSRAGLHAIEVRFEWIRGKTGTHTRQGTSKTEKEKTTDVSRRNSMALSSTAPSETSLTRVTSIPAISAPQLTVPEDRTGLRASMDSGRSRSRSGKRRSFVPRRDDESDITNSHADHGEESDGDESDPEDSETPWTCQLTMRHLAKHAGHHHLRAVSHSHGHARSASTNAVRPGSAHAKTASHPAPAQRLGLLDVDADELGVAAASDTAAEPVRVKLGVLKPAPHHPKVVAQLKVPYPLPDIEVEHLRVHKRVVTPDGIARPSTSAGRGQEGVVLTAEEMKDVLCSTAFWLIVRENVGGVGKVNRKGDGWRIRA